VPRVVGIVVNGYDHFVVCLGFDVHRALRQEKGSGTAQGRATPCQAG